MEHNGLSSIRIFSHIKQVNNLKVLDLDSEPLSFLTSHIDVNNFDKKNVSDLLSILYHTEDVIVEKDLSLADIENQGRSYFVDTTICFNCDETGHVGRDCPNRLKYLCIVCSSKDHSRHACPFVECNRCGNFGHLSKHCHEVSDRARFATCRSCRNGPHLLRDCPSVWRHYKVKNDKKCDLVKSCPICLSDSHFLDDCDFYKTKFSIFTSKYEDAISSERHNRKG